MKPLLSALVLVSTGLAPAWCAAETTYSPAYANCMDRAGGVTADMIDCIGGELAHQDARLNTAYKTLASGLTPARRDALRTVQRLWISYRDANCGFYLDPDGGSLARILANECVLRETAERADELELLRGGEG